MKLLQWAIVEVFEPVQSAHPDIRHGTRVGRSATVVVEQCAHSSPVVEYVTPARTVACAAPVTTITSGGNSVSNCDSAIHRANCAEAHGDSTGADLGQCC